MDDTLLNEYIETVIVPLYPNMNKITEFDCITGKLNCGPVILKVDAGPGRIVSSELVLEQREDFRTRINHSHGLTECNERTTRHDRSLQTIQVRHVCSRREGGASETEAARARTKEWRSCVANKRVRKELGQRNKDKALEDLQFRYDIVADSMEGIGHNPGIFEGAIPMAVHVERAETAAARVE
jgi:hypothetical protein